MSGSVAFCYASVIVFACVFSCFFSRFGGFFIFINICSVSMEARLDVVGLWVEEGIGLGRRSGGGDLSRALNQTKETRIDRCGFTGLTPISLSADY